MSPLCVNVGEARVGPFIAVEGVVFTHRKLTMSGEKSYTTKAGERPDPEVLAKPKRRRFTAAYKPRIVSEAEALRTKCGMYFPEANSPCHCVTVFSNYSPNNCPEPGRRWSLMAEISESTEKPVEHETLIERTVAALVEDGLNPDTGAISRECAATFRGDTRRPFPGAMPWSIQRCGVSRRSQSTAATASARGSTKCRTRITASPRAMSASTASSRVVA